MDKVNQEIVENKLPEFVKILESCMDFTRWGFKPTFSGFFYGDTPVAIYDNESCRVKFLLKKGDLRDGYDTLGVTYGRLLAPNDKKYIVWNEVRCHCWHYVDLFLNYLDGKSPEEAFERRYKWPQVMSQFLQANKDVTWPEPERAAKMHNVVWMHYGQRLFELFDLRKSELWKQYTSFIKEYYKLKNNVSNRSGIPPENIC